MILCFLYNKTLAPIHKIIYNSYRYWNLVVSWVCDCN